MSDVRHCDGPNCKEQVPLDEMEIHTISGAGQWITVERGHGRNLHFHNGICIKVWAAQSTQELLKS